MYLCKFDSHVGQLPGLHDLSLIFLSFRKSPFITIIISNIIKDIGKKKLLTVIAIKYFLQQFKDLGK